MNKIEKNMIMIFHVVLSFLMVLSLNIKAHSSDKTTEPVTETFVKIEAYIPRLTLKENEKRLLWQSNKVSY